MERKPLAALLIPASLLVSVALNEGYRGEAYTPIPGDVLTVGFGETAGVKAGTKTTPVRALLSLEQDLEGRKEAVGKCVTVPLSQGELTAYLDFAYNVGTTAFCSSTLVRELNQEHYPQACGQLLRWTRFHGWALKALEVRREREYNDCMGG